MINSLWISKTGMEAQQTQLDVISNNLANVSTTTRQPVSNLRLKRRSRTGRDAPFADAGPV